MNHDCLRIYVSWGEGWAEEILCEDQYSFAESGGNCTQRPASNNRASLREFLTSNYEEFVIDWGDDFRDPVTNTGRYRLIEHIDDYSFLYVSPETEVIYYEVYS